MNDLITDAMMLVFWVALTVLNIANLLRIDYRWRKLRERGPVMVALVIIMPLTVALSAFMLVQAADKVLTSAAGAF